MKGRKAFVTLLSLASLCAAASASAQTARMLRREAVGAESAPPVKWADVRVEFEGNRVFTAEQLSGAASACYERARKADEEFDLDLLDNCVQTDVRRMLMRAGYVRAVLSDPRAEPWGLSQRVTVSVEERELYRLGKVEIQGAGRFEAAALRGLLALGEGEVADGHAVVRWLGERLKRMYADEGFIQYDYEVEPEFRREPGADAGVVNFAVTIHEGRQFKLRRLSFAVNGDAPAESLRAASPLREGEAFSASKFEQTVEGLNRLGLFEPINPDADSDYRVDEETGELEIVINLTERGRGRRAANPRPARRPQTREE